MIEQKTLELMKELTQIIGIPGNEKYVSRKLQEEYQKLGFSLIFDQLGSVFAYKPSKVDNAKKVMIAGHMDEVGFIVKSVQENGLLKILPVGGIWEQTLLGQRIRLKNRAGVEFKGNIVSISPHLLTDADRAKPMSIDKMLVDVGAKSDEEIKAAGIFPNDMIVVDGPFESLMNNQRLLSKAWDDRYGLILGLEVLQTLAKVELPYDLYIGGTVQEEVGLRGAQTAGQMISPDLAIVLDNSPANDASGAKDANGVLGNGVLYRFHDRSMLPNKALLDLMEESAKEIDVAIQPYYSLGGTDAGILHKTNSGIPTLTLCIAARNIHTNSSMIDANDYISARTLLLHILNQLSSDMIESVAKSNR